MRERMNRWFSQHMLDPVRWSGCWCRPSGDINGASAVFFLPHADTGPAVRTMRWKPCSCMVQSREAGCLSGACVAVTLGGDRGWIRFHPSLPGGVVTEGDGHPVPMTGQFHPDRAMRRHGDRSAQENRSLRSRRFFGCRERYPRICAAPGGKLRYSSASLFPDCSAGCNMPGSFRPCSRGPAHMPCRQPTVQP